MGSVAEFVKALGAGRLAAMGAVAIGLIGFFAFLMLRLSQPQMGVLFTDLAFEDSIDIVRRLEGMNLPYELRQDGAIILAPKDRVPRLRMDLASQGLPAGGAVGYEIFDKSGTLGATSFVQNINRLRALEGELSRTIRSLDRVQAARVHLVLPQRQLFAKNTAEPSASIVVKVRGSLDPGQIKAIQHLTASAIEGMRPGSVSIVDETGKLLASGRLEDDEAGMGALEERGRAFERRMQQDIEDILSSIVGAGRSRVRVTAEMDYNKITETSDTYDPEGRVVRSTQAREESSLTASSGAEGVSVGNQLPSAGPQNTEGGESEKGAKTEEIVNYEISRTTKTEVIEGGRIKRLSVAVLVDGIYTNGADGTASYTPRTKEQIEQITSLVRTAMGYDASRGDQVHVANMRFVQTDAAALGASEDGSFLSMSRAEYFHAAELAVIVMVSLLVLLFVVRPLIRRILAPDAPRLRIEDLTGPMPAIDASANPLPQPELVAALPAPSPKNRAAEALKMARIEGEVHASAINDVGGIVEKNPDEAVTIVRQWIHQTA